MTKKQYISQLTQAEQGIRGKDVLEKDRAGVIDGLCDVIAEKDTMIADLSTVIASKDADIARLNQMVKMFQRQIYGRRSEKLHPEDPNQLSLDFGEEEALPVSDEDLKQAEQQVSEAMDGVRKDAEARRSAGKEKSARQRKGMIYRIPAGIPREEPVKHYPEGYTPETMVVIGWNKHETLEIEKPRMYVRQEWDAICKRCAAHRCPYENRGGQGQPELPSRLHRRQLADGRDCHRQVVQPPARVPPGEALRRHGRGPVNDERQPLAACPGQPPIRPL